MTDEEKKKRFSEACKGLVDRMLEASEQCALSKDFMRSAQLLFAARAIEQRDLDVALHFLSKNDQRRD